MSLTKNRLLKLGRIILIYYLGPVGIEPTLET